jgi:hypothetical protein
MQRRTSSPAMLGCVSLLVGCASADPPNLSSSDPLGPDGGDQRSDGACENLECRLVACPSGGTTSLSGTVYTPAGTLPLPNVTVYVPNAPLEPLADGLSCDRCVEPSGEPLAVTTTDDAGRFRLDDVPAGNDVPLVMQIGKWRRLVTVPKVPECIDTTVTAELSRLPRNQTEGDLPRIAVGTARDDAYECLLRKVGIDDSEFTGRTGPGRVNLYAGVGGTNSYVPALNAGEQLTGTLAFLSSGAIALAPYDFLMLGCEGAEGDSSDVVGRQAVFDWVNAGGRLMTAHHGDIWIRAAPQPWPTVATFDRVGDLSNPFVATVDATNVRGGLLSSWLQRVGGSPMPGQIELIGAQRSVRDVNPTLADRMVYAWPGSFVLGWTFRAPVGLPVEQQCGRVVHTDVHVSSGDDSHPTLPFPSGCTTVSLSPQEKALIFMLFDAGSCVGGALDG